MKFDVVIPTRGNLDTLNALFTSLNEQTVLPEHIFLVFNKLMSEQEWQIFRDAMSNIASPEIMKRLASVTCGTTDFIPTGASHARNYGIKLAESEYVYLIDDDNILDKNFFQKSVAECKQESVLHGVREVEQTSGKEILYSPSIGWRQTDHLQSVGIRKFHYLLSWPEPILRRDWKAKIFRAIGVFFDWRQTEDKLFYYPKMIGGNSLLGKTSVFKKLLFDERMEFIFEDIDLTYRWYRTMGPIIVSKTNVIHHMEREKTKLEQSFVANEQGVYQKARNRILFVKNNANWRQKVQFFGIGLWINTLWFTVFILLRAEHKKSMLRALWKGTGDGISL